MFKKITCSLLCAGTLLTATTFATAHNTVLLGSPFVYYLVPEVPLAFENPFAIWPISAICEMNSQDPLDLPYTPFLIHIKLMKKTAIVEGRYLLKGDEIDLSVLSGNTLSFTASPGAQVVLTNLSEHVLKASCSPASEPMPIPPTPTPVPTPTPTPAPDPA